MNLAPSPEVHITTNIEIRSYEYPCFPHLFSAFTLHVISKCSAEKKDKKKTSAVSKSTGFFFLIMSEEEKRYKRKIH